MPDFSIEEDMLLQKTRIRRLEFDSKLVHRILEKQSEKDKALFLDIEQRLIKLEDKVSKLNKQVKI